MEKREWRHSEKIGVLEQKNDRRSLQTREEKVAHKKLARERGKKAWYMQ